MLVKAAMLTYVRLLCSLPHFRTDARIQALPCAWHPLVSISFRLSGTMNTIEYGAMTAIRLPPKSHNGAFGYVSALQRCRVNVVKAPRLLATARFLWSGATTRYIRRNMGAMSSMSSVASMAGCCTSVMYMAAPAKRPEHVVAAICES